MLYRKIYGHGKPVAVLIAAVICAGLVLPLALMGNSGRIILIIMVAVLLFPYGKVFSGLFQWRVKAWVRKLAKDINGQFTEDRHSKLYQVIAGETIDGEPKIWAGNIIYHARSLHPGVRTTQDYYSLAFVVRLDVPSPFQCSLLKGKENSQYFETEWRKMTIMMGEVVSIATGELLSEEKGRETGGKLDALTKYRPANESRFNFFDVLVNNEDYFQRVFTQELLDEFFLLAGGGPAYELNITPTSLNIFTQMGPYQYIKQNLDFLGKLAERVTSISGDRLTESEPR